MNTHRLLCAALFASGLSTAQTWIETGDAGQSLGAAQIAAGNVAMTTIAGSLGGDVDMYMIHIDTPATFTASCSGISDSVLWLFDANGLGVVANDDVGFNTSASLPTGRVRTPGRYYLAVAGWGISPRTPAGLIWGTSLFNTGLPDEPGRLEPLSGWVGTGAAGPYSLTLVGAGHVRQQVVFPDSHHLSEHPQQLGSTGSSSWFTTTGSHFQILYEGSNFVAAGVNGSIIIDKLLFRTEDGEAFPANVTWNNALVRVARTSMTATAMSTNFGSNLQAPASVAAQLTTPVRLHPARGGTPNDFNIVIELGSGVAHDPTGAQPNLLVDVSLPASPAISPALPLAAVQDTTGTIANLRGVGLVGATAAASTGTLANPLVMALEFTGGNGGRERLVPARNEAIGAACGGAPSSFYQAFANGDRFDLLSLSLFPDSTVSPSHYTVSAGTQLMDGTKLGAAPVSTEDDAMVPVALGFVFPYPGGSTSNLQVSTNGFVWLNGATTTQDFTPTVGELLGITGANPARLAPFWHDLHCGRNVGTFVNSGLHVVIDNAGGIGNRACFITWKDVGVFNSVDAGGVVACSMQLVLRETGLVEFRYSGMPRFVATASTSADTAAGIVGFSRGRIGAVPSSDPISRDLSLETPFATSPEGGVGNIGLACVTTPSAGGGLMGGRLFPGQSATWNARNVPAGAVLGVQLIDIAASRPGFQLPTITAPGCLLSTSNTALLWEVDVLPPANVVGTVPFLVPSGYDGFELYAQYVVLGGLFGAPDLITQASNAIRHVVGRP